MDKNSIKILIVEDDLIIAENLKENLEEIGFNNIWVADSSFTAEEIYKKIEPKLCIVDINLGKNKPTGIDLVKQLQMDKEVPVIFLTSYADMDTRAKVNGLNIAAYLIKPVSKAQVDVSVELAINSFQVQKPKGDISPDFIFSDDVIFFKANDMYQKFKFEDIGYLKAEGSYTQIFSENTSIVLSANIGKVLNALPSRIIIRSHRSYAVNISKIDAFNSDLVFIKLGVKTIEIPIGDQFRSALLSSLTIF
jgi:DNA-binding LytR/AlgR family response regulator